MRKALIAAVVVIFLVSLQAHAKLFSVSDFGAKGDRQTNDTAAIQKAIDACSAGGGGTVSFPAGDYLCGALRLRSNLHLHIGPGATLRASRNPADYADGPRSLLFAEGLQEVTITGPGTILGIGEADLGRRADRSDAAMPPFRAGILRMTACKDVTLRDLKILYSDAWTVHFEDCDNVLVDGLTIRNNYFHTNSDGIDPVSCRNVRISNCHIIAGDDCIVIKTVGGKPCENVVVTNCTLETIATALKLGTESTGDFRNIHFSNCSIRNSTVGIGLFMKDGGTMERITFSGIDIENYTPKGQTNVERSMFPVFVDIEKRNPDSRIGRIRDIAFTDIQISSGAGLLIQGMPESPIENLTLRNITFRTTTPVDYKDRRKHVGGRRTTSDARDTLHARKPTWVAVAHIRRLVVDQLQVFAPDEDARRFPRSAVHATDLRDSILRSIYRQPAAPDSDIPAVRLDVCEAVDLQK